MRLKIISFAIACACLAGGAEAADQSGAWNPPAVGTIVQWSFAGRPVTGRIADVSGFWITEEYAGAPRQKYFGILSMQTVNGEPAQLATGKLDSFFPLEIGKSASYEFTFGQAKSLHTLKVVGYESVTVPAGTFDAFVIDLNQQGLGRNNFTGSSRIWYAPSIGSSVRASRRVSSGPDSGKDTLDELVAFTPPGK